MSVEIEYMFLYICMNACMFVSVFLISCGLVVACVRGKLLCLNLAGREEGHVCISQGGRFPPFSLEGKPPRRSIKGPDDLTLCRIYRKRTCCTAAQTHPALLSVRKLATSGEGSNECLLFWEAMECALCDPLVGVKQGPPKLCKSFCESALTACKDAFFSFDAMNQVRP